MREAWLERLLGTQFLDASVYYMSDLPAYVEGMDVVRVCTVAFLLCAVATIYPAWRASRAWAITSSHMSRPCFVRLAFSSLLDFGFIILRLE